MLHEVDARGFAFQAALAVAAREAFAIALVAHVRDAPDHADRHQQHAHGDRQLRSVAHPEAVDPEGRERAQREGTGDDQHDREHRQAVPDAMAHRDDGGGDDEGQRRAADERGGPRHRRRQQFHAQQRERGQPEGDVTQEVARAIELARGDLEVRIALRQPDRRRAMQQLQRPHALRAPHREPAHAGPRVQMPVGRDEPGERTRRQRQQREVDAVAHRGEQRQRHEREHGEARVVRAGERAAALLHFRDGGARLRRRAQLHGRVREDHQVDVFHVGRELERETGGERRAVFFRAEERLHGRTPLAVFEPDLVDHRALHPQAIDVAAIAAQAQGNANRFPDAGTRTLSPSTTRVTSGRWATAAASAAKVTQPHARSQAKAHNRTARPSLKAFTWADLPPMAGRALR